jgi:hypothetical protein
MSRNIRLDREKATQFPKGKKKALRLDLARSRKHKIYLCEECGMSIEDCVCEGGHEKEEE